MFRFKRSKPHCETLVVCNILRDVMNDSFCFVLLTDERRVSGRFRHTVHPYEGLAPAHESLL